MEFGSDVGAGCYTETAVAGQANSQETGLWSSVTLRPRTRNYLLALFYFLSERAS